MDTDRGADYRLFTPVQIATASLIGGPLPACWLIARNFTALGQPQQRIPWIAGGIAGTLLLLGLVTFVLPEHFPPYILPVAYTVALREIAKRMQGPAIAQHRAAGGRIGSWWVVVGLGLVGLVIVFALIFLVLFLCPSAVP